MNKLVYALPLILSACGGEASRSFSEDFVCWYENPGGTWRQTYEELEGTCGPIPGAVFMLIEGVDLAGGPGCALLRQNVEHTQCLRGAEFQCPTIDEMGQQRWNLTLQNMDDALVEGMGSVVIQHPQGTCQSTYQIRLERIL